MLSLFRINDLSRILLLGFLLALIRLPFWIKGVPALETDFEFRILAEALSDGRLIYRDVWHFVSPLSALIFQLAGELFGRSFVAFQILGFVVLFLQALYFNTILNGIDALKDRTLIPALFYIFFGSLIVEQFSLSQELLAMFPLLMMMDLILKQLRYGAEDGRFFSIGILFATAILFSGATLWLLPFLLIYFPFVFVMNPRRFSLFLTGIIFPFIALLLYFYLRGATVELNRYFMLELFRPFHKNYFSLMQYIVLGGIPLAIFLFGIYQSIFHIRVLNYQTSFNNMFLLISVFALPVIFFSSELSLRSFYVYLPVFSFFSAKLYLNLKRRGINELIFTALLVLTVLVNFGFAYKTFFNPKAINIDRLVLKSQDNFRDEKLAFPGDNYGIWYNNDYSGPFLFHPFTKLYFDEGLNPSKVSELHDYISKESPFVVVDPENYFENLREKDLILKRGYKKISPSVFILSDQQGILSTLR